MSVFTNPADAAKEAAESYVSAVLKLLGEKRPLDVLSSLTAEIEVLTDGLSRAMLQEPEADNKWSIAAVIQHLADSELVWGYRLRMVLSEDRPVLTGYDQDNWARHLGYQQADPAEALRILAVLRSANLSLLRSAATETLQRVGVHEERGEESVEYMIRLYAGHDLVHLRQIERIRKTVRQ